MCPGDVAPPDVVRQFAVDAVEDAQLGDRGVAQHQPDAGEQAQRVGATRRPSEDATRQAHRHRHQVPARQRARQEEDRAARPARGGLASGNLRGGSRVGHDLAAVDRRIAGCVIASTRVRAA